MKKIYFAVAACALFAMSSCGSKGEQQAAEAEGTEVVADDQVYDEVTEAPVFPGGDEALMQFICSNLSYPEASREAGIQGRVMVSFVVNVDGTVCDAKVERTPDENLGAEALRVVESMPAWQPGKLNGKVVRCRFTLPITFKFSEGAE